MTLLRHDHNKPPSSSVFATRNLPRAPMISSPGGALGGTTRVPDLLPPGAFDEEADRSWEEEEGGDFDNNQDQVTNGVGGGRTATTAAGRSSTNRRVGGDGGGYHVDTNVNPSSGTTTAGVDHDTVVFSMRSRLSSFDEGDVLPFAFPPGPRPARKSSNDEEDDGEEGCNPPIETVVAVGGTTGRMAMLIHDGIGDDNNNSPSRPRTRNTAGTSGLIPAVTGMTPPRNTTSSRPSRSRSRDRRRTSGRERGGGGLGRELVTIPSGIEVTTSRSSSLPPRHNVFQGTSSHPQGHQELTEPTSRGRRPTTRTRSRSPLRRMLGRSESSTSRMRPTERQEGGGPPDALQESTNRYHNGEDDGAVVVAGSNGPEGGGKSISPRRITLVMKPPSLSTLRNREGSFASKLFGDVVPKEQRLAVGRSSTTRSSNSNGANGRPEGTAARHERNNSNSTPSSSSGGGDGRGRDGSGNQERLTGASNGPGPRSSSEQEGEVGVATTLAASSHRPAPHRRTLHNSSIYHNGVSNLWIVTIETGPSSNNSGGNGTSSSGNRGAGRGSNNDNVQAFAFTSQHEAREATLAYSPPVMAPFADQPRCQLCSGKFAVFRRAGHCRNCGLCMCSTGCTTYWTAKRLPDTYNYKGSSKVKICMGCHVLHERFREALLRGDVREVKKLYDGGNVNLRCGLGKWNNGEILFPVHAAALGGSLVILRWLVEEHYCPLFLTRTGNNPHTTPSSSTNSNNSGGRPSSSGSLRSGSGSSGASSDGGNNGGGPSSNTNTANGGYPLPRIRQQQQNPQPLLTSRGRSVLNIAMSRGFVDVLRYVVVDRCMSLYEARDLRVALACLEGALHQIPTEGGRDGRDTSSAPDHHRQRRRRQQAAPSSADEPNPSAPPPPWPPARAATNNIHSRGGADSSWLGHTGASAPPAEITSDYRSGDSEGQREAALIRHLSHYEPPVAMGNSAIGNLGSGRLERLNSSEEEDDDDDEGGNNGAVEDSDDINDDDTVTTVADACIICYENTIDCVMTPCGHQICCLKCSTTLSLCPICNTDCSFIRIFKP